MPTPDMVLRRYIFNFGLTRMFLTAAEECELPRLWGQKGMLVIGTVFEAT